MNKQYTIGIDIGGTNMKAVLFDGKNVIADDILATPKDNLEHLLVMMQALINPFFEKIQNSKIQKIGIGVAGIIDNNEKIIFAPNIPILENVKLSKEVEKIFNIPSIIDNDTNCFVLAESELGIAKKYNNIFGITVGTGIGGSWYFDKKIYKGFSGGAGEIGHFIMDTNNKLDLENIYKKLNQGNSLNLAREAYLGDVLAEKAYQEFGETLGILCANIVNVIDPEILILGGSIIKSDDLFLPETKKTMRQYIVSPSQKKIKILKSILGEYAGAIGAAIL